MRLSLGLILAAALLCVSAGQTNAATITANPTNIAAAFARAKPGDTLTLSAGEYPAKVIKARHFSPALVVELGGAVLVGWRFIDVQGLVLKGGTYALPPAHPHPRTGEPTFGQALRFDGSRQIRITNARFQGPGDHLAANPIYGEGIGLSGSLGGDFEVIDSRFAGLRVGAVIERFDGFRFIGNQFLGMRSDGFDVALSRNGLIEGNECSGTRIRSQEHPDCIQLWSRPPEPPTADVVIRKNKIVGATQGVGLYNHVRDGVNDGGFDRIIIEDNDIETMFPNGIALFEARDSVVRNNRVRTAPGAEKRASIQLDPAVKRCGNVVAPGAGKVGVTDRPC